jgi:hypothetical protein
MNIALTDENDNDPVIVKEQETLATVSEELVEVIPVLWLK